MLRWPLVKICGISDSRTAVTARQTGATAVGLVLDRSIRQVTPETARRIAEDLRGTIEIALVFRNSSRDRVIELATYIQPDWVQLHGDESGEDVSFIAEQGWTVVKGIDAQKGLAGDFPASSVSGLLVDGQNPGSGETADYSSLLAQSWNQPLIAAGGLNPATVESVISLGVFRGVDVSSGVESSPGVKDPALIEAFVRAASRGFELLGDVRN
jgi:phosphoribosylanthranilate isomerase